MPDPQAVIDEARRLFNARLYWHVHEVLEELWKRREGREKDLLQGLILVAAALVHAQKKEMQAVWSMLARALPKLEHPPDLYYGWDVRKFRSQLTRILARKKLRFPTV